MIGAGLAQIMEQNFVLAMDGSLSICHCKLVSFEPKRLFIGVLLTDGDGVVS